MLSSLISSVFFSIFVSSSYLDDYILLFTMLLKLIFSIRSSKYVVILEICFPCSIIFYGKLFVFYFRTLVYS